MDFAVYGKQLFEQLVNCTLAGQPEEGSFVIGETRLADVQDFTSTFMRTWVNQPEFTKIDISQLNLLQQQDFYKNRFCSLEEYLLLFTAPPGKHLQSPVFILLGINNELERTKFKNLFTPDNEGYFKLMKVYNPSLWTFFFPGRHA